MPQKTTTTIKNKHQNHSPLNDIVVPILSGSSQLANQISTGDYFWAFVSISVTWGHMSVPIK